MSRRTVVFDELKDRGYDITSFKKLSGGINSSVFFVSCRNQKCYALKLYRLSSSHDSRNRCQSEVNFLDYLRFCDISSCPKLIEYNFENAWSLISWINGEKPTSLSILQLHQIIDFIYSINRPELHSLRLKLHPASDAFQSMNSTISSIKCRISSFYCQDITSEISYQAINWIRTTIEPLLVDLIHDLSLSSRNHPICKDSDITLIASPSDFGVHNMLSQNETLYYLDFEYAGLDDISKLFADFILQPNFTFNCTQEKYFLDLASLRLENILDKNWLYRYNQLKPFFLIKWSLIMLNNLKYRALDEYQFNKTLLYFERNKSILY